MNSHEFTLCPITGILTGINGSQDTVPFRRDGTLGQLRELARRASDSPFLTLRKIFAPSIGAATRNTVCAQRVGWVWLGWLGWCFDDAFPGVE